MQHIKLSHDNSPLTRGHPSYKVNVPLQKQWPYSIGTSVHKVCACMHGSVHVHACVGACLHARVCAWVEGWV